MSECVPKKKLCHHFSSHGFDTHAYLSRNTHTGSRMQELKEEYKNRRLELPKCRKPLKRYRVYLKECFKNIFTCKADARIQGNAGKKCKASFCTVKGEVLPRLVGQIKTPREWQQTPTFVPAYSYENEAKS